MKIENYFNASKDEIVDKKLNILLGVSLGNKYFTKENLKDYILWSVENTKEKIAILIPDKIHSINYEIKNKYSKQRASQVSYRKGQEIEKIIREIISEFPKNIQDKIFVVHWEDIEDLRYQIQKTQILEEFENNVEFKREVIDIVRENTNGKALELHDLEKLALYVLNELPMLISGINYQGNHFGLLPYPGLSKIDYLVFDLQENRRFHDLAKKLNIK